MLIDLKKPREKKFASIRAIEVSENCCRHEQGVDVPSEKTTDASKTRIGKTESKLGQRFSTSGESCFGKYCQQSADEQLPHGNTFVCTFYTWHIEMCNV